MSGTHASCLPKIRNAREQGQGSWKSKHSCHRAKEILLNDVYQKQLLSCSCTIEDGHPKPEKKSIVPAKLSLTIPVAPINIQLNEDTQSIFCTPNSFVYNYLALKTKPSAAKPGAHTVHSIKTIQDVSDSLHRPEARRQTKNLNQSVEYSTLKTEGDLNGSTLDVILQARKGNQTKQNTSNYNF